jgi:hypothetical protein
MNILILLLLTPIRKTMENPPDIYFWSYDVYIDSHYMRLIRAELTDSTRFTIPNVERGDGKIKFRCKFFKIQNNCYFRLTNTERRRLLKELDKINLMKK